MGKKQVKVGLAGLGIVGGGVARLLMEQSELLSRRLGAELVLAKAADLDASRAEELGLAPGVYVKDAAQVWEDPEIDLFVELVGGYTPAREFVLAAIAAGKHVVTANKALLAAHGVEIFAAAAAQNVAVAYEASVGGGIPLIRSLREGLAANRVSECLGILNGTCNYILTRMTAEKAPFAQVLADAQANGYAEADPTFDVEGIDTAHKLAIVAALATGAQPNLADIPTEGITGITPLDLEYATEFGYNVKLLAILRVNENGVEARVHPALVRHDHLLASVNGPMNALHISGDWVGDVLLYGQGAGRRPTASAVVGDILDLARDIKNGCGARVPSLGYAQPPEGPLAVAPISDSECKYYFRFSAMDRPGVLASIANILGDHGISIQAVSQKGRQREQGAVPIVVLTHEARELSVSRALKAIDDLPVIAAPTLLIRVA